MLRNDGKLSYSNSTVLKDVESAETKETRLSHIAPHLNIDKRHIRQTNEIDAVRREVFRDSRCSDS